VGAGRRCPASDDRAGLTLILVTHDTSIARRARRTAVMTDGHLTIHGSASTTTSPGYKPHR